jgi:Ca2+-binding EF-hand superfamily protein
MGNISSEVGRAINAKKQNNKENMDNAVIRALDLFDATIDELISAKSIRSKEVLRSKDQFLTVINEESPSTDELNSLERYFTQYAIAARLNK